jgi:hypothetical protein
MGMKFLNLIAAFVIAGFVYWSAETQGTPAALAIIAFYIAIMWALLQERMDSLAKMISSEFSLLRHLQRLPRDSEFGG